ncbi:MAG: UDP-3-O-(3-hydroxymyristoyl)glucosamine N-acyltransferase [Flavobacteriales bacterium Tduv]
MKFTAQQIAEFLEGEVLGDPSAEVSKFSKIEKGEKGAISFLSNPKYTQYLYETSSSIVIVNRDFIQKKTVSSTLIKVENAYHAFMRLLKFYQETFRKEKSEIEQPSFITPTAQIGKDVYIGAFCYIGANVVLGDGVKIYPNTFIGDDVLIGDHTVIYSGVHLYVATHVGKHCVIHSGSVIGSDGFGFASDGKQVYHKIPQLGNVIIEDFVEVGACCTIDRSTLGSTIIRSGVKLDNQIQVAHNVEIGSDTVIAAQTGIAGSSSIGKSAMIGGQAGIVGHLEIGDHVKIAAQSGITKDLPDKSVVQGSPAFPVLQYKKSYAYFKNLPDLAKRLDQLENKVES